LAEKEELATELSKRELEFKDSLTKEKINFNKILREFEIEKNKTENLEEKISWLEENALVQENKLEVLSSELSLIKEEAASHITTISILKNENKSLIEHLQHKEHYEERLAKEIKFLYEQIDTKNEEMNRDRITLTET